MTPAAARVASSRVPEVFMRLDRDLIIKALGDVDDVVIAKILGTDASCEELAEAKAWLDNDEPLLNRGKRLPSGRVSELAAVLEKLQEEALADPDGP
jgi:hypothetical protein